ncbi:MAG: DUF2304 domain-containing protein, partial [Solirubrobacterales bacterium]|nr:DUF2304 domain-containing protein [Solirubrobacterales bacterium]MBV9474281.1 DUF2304 domain-containing protein [Solirubrobacterales bacterium]
AVWKNLLTTVSKAIGIYYPPNAFFVIAFAFLLLLLLHFSAVVSRLADETRVLAQRLALQEEHSRQQPADARADETPVAGGDPEPLAGGDPEPLASGDREPGQLAARGWSPRRSSG